MILRFTQAVTKQELLIMRSAITAVVPTGTPGVTWVHTANGVAFEVLATMDQIQQYLDGQNGLNTVAIAAIGG